MLDNLSFFGELIILYNQHREYIHIIYCSRQYNRKKKPVPGALAEDDLERVEIPPDILVPPAAVVDPPSTSTLSTSSPAVLPLNSEIAAAAAEQPAAVETPAEAMEEDEAKAAVLAAEAEAAERKKVPSPKLKINTPKKPKPNK